VVQEEAITKEAAQEADAAAQAALKQRGALPRHIAVIMDGNGRWAKAQGRPRVAGHREGVKAVRDVTEACAELGIEYLTLYTFSTENWYRPAQEVNALMELLIRTLRRETKTLLKNNIRLHTVGDLSQLPSACLGELQESLDATATNRHMTLVLALSYSGRWDLKTAMQTLARRVQDGTLDPDAIDEQAISEALTTRDLPDPDLLIRTGGDYRVSNFLLWEIAYTELYISDEFWPAFRRPHLYEAIRNFQDRERRFGRVKH
jgi:undecaprenyl diphosphate synthase